MTLVATCPHCRTSFRVVADQLKLRRGLVRCGRCQQVFSGVDALTYLDEAAETTQIKDAARVTLESVAPSHAPDESATAAETAIAAAAPEVAPEVAPEPAPEPAPEFAIETATETATAGAAATEALETKPEAQPQRRILLILLIVLGLLGASAQALIGWRHELAYRLPALQPFLALMSEKARLDLQPPRDARSLTIESFEVVAAQEPMKLTLEAVIRNRSDRPVAFPSIELTLRDSQSVMLTRRVIAAQDYVVAEQQGRGIPAQSEWTVNLLLEHDGLAVAGYSAVLFHP